MKRLFACAFLALTLSALLYGCNTNPAARHTPANTAPVVTTEVEVTAAPRGRAVVPRYPRENRRVPEGVPTADPAPHNANKNARNMHKDVVS